MKKLFCALVAAVMLLSLQILPTAYADEYSDLCQALASSCVNDTQVDISRFGVNEDALDAAFVDVWYSGRLPWNVYSYSYSLADSGAVTSFAPIYYDSTQYDPALYQQAVDTLFSQVIRDGMTQWEMALAVHDYLAVNSCYDETLQRNTNYDLLVNGTAVCSGYAMAYLDIMTRLGIPCRFVESQPMAHAWNMVKLDGSWYHIDLTHDDPTPDSYGYVSHERFLKTDKEMTELGYYGWDNGISCTDEAFTDPLWKNVNSMFCYADGQWFFRAKNDFDYIIRSGAADLYTIPATALTLEEDAYNYETNGLSFYDGKLWFSGVDQVWSVAPDGSGLQTVFRYDVEKNGKFIYGSLVKDGKLYLTLSDGEYQFSSKTVSLTDTEAHTHNYVETTLEGSCTEGIGVSYICKCGLSYDGQTLPAAGHTYEAYISRQATCQEAGEKTYVCSVCGVSYMETFTDPDAHSYESVILQKQSFFKEGLKQLHCSLCGYVALETMPKLSFQKQFGLTVWSTLAVIALFICIPTLIVNSRKRK